MTLINKLTKYTELLYNYLSEDAIYARRTNKCVTDMDLVGTLAHELQHSFDDNIVYRRSKLHTRKGTLLVIDMVNDGCFGYKEGTLAAMNVPEEIATSAVRISLGDQNTLEEADEFNRTFDELYAGFKKIID